MQFVTWPYQLRRGHSDNPAEGACAMDAVNWLVHGKHGDVPECACPVIGAHVILGNDAMPHDVRQRLLPFLHRIAGSRSPMHAVVRTEILNRYYQKLAAKEVRWSIVGMSLMPLGMWDDYFAVLDEALNAGPQGEPWSADVVKIGVGLYDKAVA